MGSDRLSVEGSVVTFLVVGLACTASLVVGFAAGCWERASWPDDSFAERERVLRAAVDRLREIADDAQALSAPESEIDWWASLREPDGGSEAQWALWEAQVMASPPYDWEQE
jgi:acyl-CoA reductase-like NAD-dependent aldehyde dehydrogenase